jgi:hypothetical protein
MRDHISYLSEELGDTMDQAATTLADEVTKLHSMVSPAPASD